MYPEGYHDEIWRSHVRESICIFFTSSKDFLLKTIWMKELGSEVAGGGKDSQQTQPKSKNPIVRTGRPVLSEQQSGSSVQEIENVSNVTAKAPMKEHGDLFSSCVSVSV